MSRLFPDRLLLELAPASITLARLRGPLHKQRMEKRSLACDPAYGNEPWQGAIAALKSLEFKEPCKVTLVLSSQFVRYAVVPWSGALATAAEEDAYLRHYFVKIHGERAKTWVLRASEGAAGAARLASAIDAALLEEIRNSFPRGGKAKLSSVQPQLMSRFNQHRKSVPAGGAWLVIAEPDRACVALHVGGGWRSVQSGKGPWLDLLERERFRVHAGDGELPNVVLITGAPAPSPQGAWQFRELGA